MKWEPKRKRAAEEGGSGLRDPLIAIGIGGTGIASYAAPATMGAAGLFAAQALPGVIGVGNIASAANLWNDRINGSERAASYREKVLAGKDTGLWEDWSAPVDFSMKFSEDQQERADLKFYQDAITAMRTKGMSRDQVQKRLGELQEEREKNARYDQSWFGQKARNITGTLAGLFGLAHTVYNNEDDKQRRKDLATARNEYYRLRKFGEYERAADDDDRAKIYMDSLTKRMGAIARLRSLANGSIAPSDEEAARYKKTGFDRALKGMEDFDRNLEKEFAANYRSAYDRLMTPRQELIYKMEMADKMAEMFGRSVDYKEFSTSPLFADSYSMITGMGLRGLEQRILDKDWRAKAAEAARKAEAARIVNAEASALRDKMTEP